MTRKILFLLAAIALVSLLWFMGAQVLYAHLLAFLSNIFLGAFGSDASVSLEALNGQHLFRVSTTIDGRTGSYPQELQSLLYPAIIVLSWSLFLLFSAGFKRALRSTSWCLLPFLVIHMIFLLLLTGYYSSGVARFLYDILRESLFVIAITLVIVDQIRSSAFSPSTSD